MKAAKIKIFIRKFRRLSPRAFIALTMAGIVSALGVTLFLYPVKLYDSGISGTSILLSQITPLTSLFLRNYLL